jgi:cytochrome c-type biogenesis protein CcmH/NrfG
MRLGKAYEQNGQPDEATQSFDKAIRYKPSLIEAYQSRAHALYRAKQYDKAWADVMTVERLGGQPEAVLLKSLTQAAPPQSF